MKISIKVMPGSRKNDLRQEGEVWKVYLTAPALEGRANEALVKFLAERFRCRPSAIEILKGLKSRHKIVNIKNI